LWSDSHGIASRLETQPLCECSSGTNSSVCIKTECSTHSQPAPNAELIDHFLGEHSLSGAINRSFYTPEIQEVQLSNSRKPDYLISSIWLEAETVPGVHIEWVNRTFWEMRAKGRWLAKQGLEVSAIMGDTCPSLHPDPRSGEDDAVNFWTVSRWAARFVDKFLDISHSDRLACWIVMFVTFQVWCPVLVQAILLDYADGVQWQICPNSETYRAIPDWYRPLHFQRFMPHMACLDILIWYAITSLLIFQYPLPKEF
jgi:hypothetical protein